MPQGTVAVRVLLSTQVMLVRAVAPRVTVGVATKSVPVMVTEVSMSLVPEGVDGAHRGDDRRDGEGIGQAAAAAVWVDDGERVVTGAHAAGYRGGQGATVDTGDIGQGRGSQGDGRCGHETSAGDGDGDVAVIGCGGGVDGADRGVCHIAQRGLGGAQGTRAAPVSEVTKLLTVSD